jgi:hypothetical protein
VSDELNMTTLQTYFRFPFSGTGWKNRLLAGMGIMLGGFFVPFLPWMLLEGYNLRILRQTALGGEPELAEWKDWGGLLLDGLKVTVVRLIYLLPAYAFMFGGMAVYFFSFMIVPLVLTLPGVSRGMSSSTTGLLMAVFMFISLGVLFLALALGMLFLLLGAVPMPAAIGRLAVTGQLKEGLKLRPVIGLLRANPTGWLAAWVITMGLFYLAMLLAMILYYSLVLMCLAPLVMVPCMMIALVISSALFGESYARAAQPAPAA